MSIKNESRPVAWKNDYTPEKGKLVAELFADGETLNNIYQQFIELLPAPMYIKQWRRDHPQFNELMKMAEAALADLKMEQADEVAGDVKIPAAHGANRIKVKMAQAAALDSQVWGNRRILAGDKDNPLAIKAVKDLNHEELMTIARGGVVEQVASGEDIKNLPEGRGRPPLVAVDGGTNIRVWDTKIPSTVPAEDSVTTSDDDTDNGVEDIEGVDPGF